MNCSQLKETKGTCGLNLTHGPRLNPFATKNIIGATAHMECVLWIK